MLILLAGLLFGPSAPISKNDFDKLVQKVDDLDKKVGGLNTPLSQINTKLDAVAKASALEEQAKKILSGLEEAKRELTSSSQETSAKLEELSLELAGITGALQQLQEKVTRMEANFAEKLRASLWLEDDQKDSEGKSTCVGPSLLIRILNDQDIARLQEMGIDKDGDGVVCALFSWAFPAELLQSP